MSKKQTIYNHRVSDALADNNIFGKQMAFKQHVAGNNDLDKTLGLHNYSGRVLGSTNPGDILQLNAGLKKHWDWIAGHYALAGIQHAQEIIWDDSYEVMSDFPTYDPSVFFFGDRANNARPNNDWYDVVRRMNSKNEFIETCLRLGIETPATWCYDCKSEVDVDFEFPFPIYLKIAVSISGLGVVRCDSTEELEAELLKIERRIPLQIQQGKDAFTFLNLQYRKNGKLERVLATEQVLKGCCHVGNAYPTNHQPWEITDVIAHEMVDQGMQGYFAFDLAVCNESNGIKYYAIECNPRFNGSSYPTNIATKLCAKKWVAKKVVTDVQDFSNIDLGEIQYTPEKAAGVVVVNWGSISEKQIGVMLIADDHEQENMLEEKLKEIFQ